MPTSDILFIQDLKIDAIVGLYAWEQRIRQILVFDLEFKVDVRKIAHSDSLADSVDYAQVAARMTDFVTSKPFILIETLAQEVAELLLREFKVDWLKLRVRKPGAVANAKEVGVVIERN